MKIRLSRKHIRKVTPNMNIKVIPSYNFYYDLNKFFNFMFSMLLMQIYVSKLILVFLCLYKVVTIYINHKNYHFQNFQISTPLQNNII